jgi:hypothetical protein
MTPTRERLFYCEKNKKANRILRLDLREVEDGQYKRKYFDMDEGAAVINFVTPDDLSLFVLYTKNGKYYLRVFETVSGKHIDKLVSGRRL